MKELRESYKNNNRKLRRARRLYGKLISDSVIAHPQLSIVCATRAQDFGMYSDKTEFRSVVFSILRYAYKHSDFFDRVGGFGWYKFCDDKCLMNRSFRLVRPKGKPKIKLNTKVEV